MKPSTAWIALILAPSVAMLSVPAAALTTTTYSLATGCTANSTNFFKNNSLVAGTTAAHTPGTCTGSGVLTSLTGISDTGKGGTPISSNWTLQTAYIGKYGTHLGVTSTAGKTSDGSSSTLLDGGTGILATGSGYNTDDGITSESTSSPQHALDNSFNHEAMLLTFNTAVSLTDIKLGYYNTDSDLTVYAYTASQDPVANTGLLGSTFGALTGWTKIGDYTDAGGAPNSGSDVTPSISKNVSNTTLSSYWLIAAYTGSATGTGANTLSVANDYVKLLSVAACTGAAGCSTGGGGGSSVPEPSTVLLVGVALLGLTGLRRRKAV